MNNNRTKRYLNMWNKRFLRDTLIIASLFLTINLIFTISAFALEHTR